MLVDPYDHTPPTLAIDPPQFTRQVGTVTITSDKPATIFFTIDGSPVSTASTSGRDRVVIPNVPDNAQLRTFAVDLNDNQSPEVDRLWIIDRDGPSAPVDFKLALNNTTRTVTWAVPPDPRPGGVLVTRVEGRLGAPPVGGTAYKVGDVVSPGVTVVAVSTNPTDTFSESIPAKPGMVRYVGWAFDNLLNYSQPAGDYALVPLPTEAASLTVNATSVTVTSPAPDVTISGTSALVGSTLTVKLTVRNDSTRTLFAPKLALTNTPAGATWTNPDGTVDTSTPFRSYGGALVPGEAATEDWVFAGASANTTLALAVQARDNFVMTSTMGRGRNSAGSIIDFVTGADLRDLASGPTGQGGRGPTKRGGFTPDGTVIFGSRTTGTVSAFDVATGHKLATALLAPPKSHVPQVILDRSGSSAYALVGTGHPEQNSFSAADGVATQLVRLDAATLTEVTPRLDIGNSRNRCIDMSPDGKTIIIATATSASGVLVIDVPTMSIRARIKPSFKAQCAVFSPDGQTIAAVGEQIELFTSDGTSTGTAVATPGTNGKVVRAVFGTPDLLWVGRQRETVIVDLKDGTTQELATTAAPMMEVFDGKVYIGSRNVGVQRFDAVTAALEATIAGFPTTIQDHWIGRSPF